MYLVTRSSSPTLPRTIRTQLPEQSEPGCPNNPNPAARTIRVQRRADLSGGTTVCCESPILPFWDQGSVLNRSQPAIHQSSRIQPSTVRRSVTVKRRGRHSAGHITLWLRTTSCLQCVQQRCAKQSPS